MPDDSRCATRPLTAPRSAVAAEFQPQTRRVGPREMLTLAQGKRDSAVPPPALES